MHAPTRAEAVGRMQRALDEFLLEGIKTNIPLHKRLLADDEVVAGTMTTRSVDRILAR